MVASTMATQTQQRRAWWFAPLLLLVAGGGVAFAYAAASSGSGMDTMRFPVVAGSCVLAAIVILLRVRSGNAWRSAPSLGLGLLALAVVNITLLITDASGPNPPRVGIYDVAFLATGALFLVAVAIEFREHVPREDRREIAADVSLLSAATGTMPFLALRNEAAATAEPTSAASAAAFALLVASGFAAFGALSLARPNASHFGMFVAICAMCAGVYAFSREWLQGAFEVGQPAIDLPIA